MNEQVIIIFLRAPEKGRVKTRLARGVGETLALDLYKKFAEKTLVQAAAAGMELLICFCPADQLLLVKDWLGKDLHYAPQKGDDLGPRMANALSQVFEQGAKKALLVGCDIPDIKRAHFLQAFKLLDQADGVLGPSRDGGYWLIGFNRDSFFPGVFQRVDWGTSTVLATTCDRCRTAGLIMELLPVLRDLDTLADLEAFYKKNSSWTVS